MGSKRGKAYRRRLVRMYKQERKEHPTFTPKQIRRIVHDHLNERKNA